MLRTIQTLGQSPSLKPVSLRLMGRLWQIQNRVFPHLQRALNSVDTNVEVELNLDIQMAKAACLSDICKLRYSINLFDASLTGLNFHTQNKYNLIT